MGAVVVRSPPAPVKKYDEYREQLRFDFWYACAYCSATEFESRGHSFEIDHFQPQLHGGTDAYGNLYWACESCNRKKDAYWPNPTKLAEGYLVVRVDLEDPRDHIGPDPERQDHVSAKTNQGETSIKVLDLNAQRIRRIREIRRRLTKSEELVLHGIRSLGRARIDQLPNDLKILTTQLRTELATRASDVPDEIDELARAFSKSELLDPDPDAEAGAKLRRRFLTESGALPMRKPRKKS